MPVASLNAMQRFGRYSGESGHWVDTVHVLRLTQSVISRPSITALRKDHSITSSVSNCMRPVASQSSNLAAAAMLVRARVS
jgi:hypothetical protein